MGIEQIEQQATAGESEVVGAVVEAAETVVWGTGGAVAEAEGIAAAVSKIVATTITEN